MLCLSYPAFSNCSEVQLGHLVAFLLWMVLSVGLLVVWIMLLIKANQGPMWKLPVIGDMAEKQANA